jgi:hypothetical protein
MRDFRDASLPLGQQIRSENRLEVALLALPGERSLCTYKLGPRLSDQFWRVATPLLL